MQTEVEIRWNSLSRDRWERLAKAAMAPLPQCWTYGEAFAGTGATIDRAELRLGGRTMGLAQFVNRHALGILPYALLSRGPVWTADLGDARKADLLSALRRGPSGGPRRAVLITPVEGSMSGTLQVAGLTPLMSPATLAVLDLSQGAQAARTEMHQKWRNRLSAAERSGIPYNIVTDPGRLDWLLAQERHQQFRRHYRNYPAAFFRAWAQADPKSVDLRCFTIGGQPLAAMLTLIHGRTATYQLGWSGTAGRATGAHNLLLWSLIRALCKRGIQRLDLGLLDTERAPGLARFKLGAGARPVVLGGTHLGWRVYS